MTYMLTSADQNDFSRRLEDFLCSGEHDFGVSFLTPTSIRGHRAKSMLATTTKTSTSGGMTSKTKLIEEETEGDYASCEKRRSSIARARRSIVAPRKFQNCEECGAIYFGENCVAVKPRQYCYRLETIPSGLLCSFFKLQGEQRKVWLRTAAEVEDPYGQQLYLNGRKRIIDGVYKMGVKFQQARETIHIAIEIIDQFYLRKSQQLASDVFKEKLMHPRLVILHQVTSLMLASKYDEVDDNITAIRDLRTYVSSQLQALGKKDPALVPTYDQIVECERVLLEYFDWNLRFLLPLHFIRLQLANGILFTNELKFYEARLSPADLTHLKQELTRALTTEALSLSDLLISKGACFLRKEQPSDIAAAVIYFARKNILFSDQASKHVKVPALWPEELILMTRCTESQIKKLLSNPLEESYSLDPGSTQASATKTQERKNPHSKSLVRTAEHKKESSGKGPHTISPPAKPTMLKMAQKNYYTKTESKPNQNMLFTKQDNLKKPHGSAKVVIECSDKLYTERSERQPSDIQSQGAAVRQILSKVAEQSQQSSEPQLTYPQRSQRPKGFQANLVAAQVQLLRLNGQSAQETEASSNLPLGQSGHGMPLSFPSTAPLSKQTSEVTVKNQLIGPPRQAQHYIPTASGLTNSKSGINIHNKGLVGVKGAGQENCGSMNSLDSQLEINGSLPEIQSVDSQKQAIYETMSKKNFKGAIANIAKEARKHDGRTHISQNSVGSFSQAPLSSSKRPKNQIGFAESAAQQPIAEKKNQGRQKRQNSNQQAKTSRQNIKVQKGGENRNNGANRKNNQRLLCLPQSIITSQIAEVSNEQPNATRNNALSRKESNQAIKKMPSNSLGSCSQLQSTNELPTVSTPSEYFSYKQVPSSQDQSSKIGIVDEAQSQSSKQNLDQPPSESLIKVMNYATATATATTNTAAISPALNLKAANKKIGVNFRSSKAYQSMTASMNQPMATLRQLKAHEQFQRATSQEQVKALHEKSPTGRMKAAKFLSIESIENLTSSKPNDFYKTQSAKIKTETSQNQIMSTQLPTIGSQTQLGLKENENQYGNLQDAVKERFSSSNMDHKTVHQHGKIFSKTTKLDKKPGKDSKTASMRSLPKSQIELGEGLSKNRSQYFGGKLTCNTSGPSMQANVLGSQRVVLNQLRKGPSFAGMANIATPSGCEEQAKQNSHRILTKGVSHQQLASMQSIKQLANQKAISKFAKNAANKNGRNANNLRSQGSSSNSKMIRSSQNNISSAINLAQSQANISQTLAQVAATSALNSKQGSCVRSSANLTQGGGAYVPLEAPNAANQHRRTTMMTSSSSNLNQQQSPVVQPQRLAGQVVKPRNHNGSANLAGVPLHGLINANYTNISKTTDSKGSFTYTSQRRRSTDQPKPQATAKPSGPKAQVSNSTQQLSKLRQVKNQVRQQAQTQAANH